ncbi:unnamed protein product [Arctia plantaginis]|uniref:Partial AB-hydrolase lipase domain-containing protein n=1 Tax=Arctia plantaginis TaxID=874455 RepID=A0A8S0Z0H9_ARCPL|nr:unnamed protein product [Arctia plantaginis]
MAQRLVLLYVTVKYCAVKQSDSQMTISSTSNFMTEPVLEFSPTVKPENRNVKESDVLARLLMRIERPYYKSNIHNTRAIESFIKQINAGIPNPDSRLSFRHIVNKYGYECERHEVLTKDGYLLTMFRIPGDGPPVFLMHGLLGSADDFILAGPDSALAYLLSREKYDVWLGNARGNKYCRRHNFLNTSEALFWNFSWHEIGIYDLPAMIDYVLGTTNRTTLIFIGYSQGSTSFFVMASEKPEYNRKISLMIALSPATFMTRVRTPIIRLLALGTSLLYEMSGNVGLYEFQPSRKLEKMLRLLICGKGKVSQIICSNFIFLIAGVNPLQLNVSNLPVIFSHFPSGASMKQLTHYAQGLLYEDFKKFDHGSMENLERYGEIVPPSYTLENVVTPISLFCSESDWLSDAKDVEILSYKLKNMVDIYRVPNDGFTHADFIIANDVKTLVYARLLKVLTRF